MPTTNTTNTILQMQIALLKRLDPSISIKMLDDGITIVASNISEAIFPKLEFVTNNPGYSNGYLELTNIEVFLKNERYPTSIYGLFPIVQQRIANSDADAFIRDHRSHEPFINGFQEGRPIGAVVDILSNLSRNTPDTFGIIKTFTLYIDPPGDQSPQSTQSRQSPQSTQSTQSTNRPC